MGYEQKSAKNVDSHLAKGGRRYRLVTDRNKAVLLKMVENKKCHDEDDGECE